MFDSYCCCVISVVGALTICLTSFKVIEWMILMMRCYAFPSKLDFTKYGKWAVITGAGDGIGKALAHQLANRGMNVAMISLLPKQLNEVSRNIEMQHGVKTRTLAVNFNTSDSKIYEIIGEFLEGLDVGVLVNNVGMSTPHYAYSELPEASRRSYNVVNVNVLPLYQMCNLVIPSMIKKGRGLIMNMSSLTATRPMPYLSLYSSTKCLVNHFSQTLALENAENGIEVQSVQPGLVHTNMTADHQKTDPCIVEVNTFVRSLLGTVGKTKRTHGCFVHELLAVVMKFIPDWFLRRMMRKISHQESKKEAIEKPEVFPMNVSS